MPSSPERSPYRWAGRGLVGLLLVLVAIPAYLTLAPSWRTLGIRLGCALLVIAGCVRLTRGARRAIEEQPLSALDLPPRPFPARELDERFLRLRGDLVASARSQRYFDAILWPRLVALAGEGLPRLATPRALWRRGPSLRTIEHLVAEAEKRA
jgi:hypothetical protein